MIRTPEGDLEQELRDPEYVKLYGASDAKAEIAITLAEARHAAKKTQTEVADAMSLSQPYVARLEGGEANPTIGTIGSLLAVMGFRLVTQTAPLSPEPVSLAMQSMVAADVGVNVFIQMNNPYGADYGDIRFPAVESMNDLVPGRKADYPRKAAVAGGTV